MTAQMHERLVFDGVETSTPCCPPVPIHARIVRRQADALLYWSTACKRGYQGTWEIREGRFYLAGLTGCFELVGSDPLLAEWYTGVLRVPRGEVLHLRFGSAVYEAEVHIQIQRGLVVGTRVIDNRATGHDRPSGLRASLARWLRRVSG